MYKYEAFFSYKRDPESDAWHHRVHQILLHWLRLELRDNSAEVFIDRDEIRPGDIWTTRLANAIKCSRCIVCIWSPGYFDSEWCVSEWLSFAEREQLLARLGSLIIPASYHDGVSFPSRAKAYQYDDFSSYASTMPFFWRTEDAYRFEQDKLKRFAQAVAAKIKAAPEYNEAFPVVAAKPGDLLGDPTIKRPGDT
jgi:hypothetical protein